jgi:hypothetical protein
MRIRVISVALFSLCVACPAAAVTLDFESEWSVTSFATPAAWGVAAETIPVSITTQGFSFGFRGSEAEWNAFGGGPYVATASYPNFEVTPVDFFPGMTAPFGNGGSGYSIWQENDALFSMQSLDVAVGYIGSPDGNPFLSSLGSVYLSGYDSGDSLVASLALSPIDGQNIQTAVFDASWTNLAYVTVSSQSYSDCCALGESTVAIDNLTATVVPIPAAVWLFGSALAGLGWMRQRQTV